MQQNRHTKHTLLFALGLATLLAAPSTSMAQAFRLDRHVAPMTAEDGVRLGRPVSLEARQWGAMLSFDYAHDPLVLDLPGNDEGSAGELVQHQLVGQARVAYGLVERLTLGAGMDVGLVMSGDSYDTPPGDVHLDPADGAAVGDLRIGARYVPWGDAESRWQVAAQVHVIVPTRASNLTGEAGLAIAPAVVGELRADGLRLTLELGALVRKDGRIAATDVGDEVRVGLGGAASLDSLAIPAELLVELHGASTVASFLGREGTALEVLGGVRWLPGSGLSVTAAGGAGLSAGVGTPDARAVLSAGYRVP